MTKILIAPNAFKGTIEATEASIIIEQALLRIRNGLEIKKCPIADGGDGTCLLIGELLGLKKVYSMALDALGRQIEGYFFIDEINKTAYLDVSTVSGIRLVENHERDPKITSTYGTGVLINKAIDAGATHLVLGLGGSSTIDLGLGILRSLGYVFLDKNGNELSVFSENYLQEIFDFKIPNTILDISFTCICDVSNRFFGEKGAIPTFGPQKGLDTLFFKSFEESCWKILKIFSKKTGKNIEDRENFGAAGGISFGLSFFFPVDIKMGASWFFEKADLSSKVKWSDLIITGEGRYDSQSLNGKGSYELLQLAKKYKKKVYLVTSGSVEGIEGFEKIIILPDLDLSSKTFKKTAKMNLTKSIIQIGDYL